MQDRIIPIARACFENKEVVCITVDNQMQDLQQKKLDVWMQTEDICLAVLQL